jgi:hypothetical protein
VNQGDDQIGVTMVSWLSSVFGEVSRRRRRRV